MRNGISDLKMRYIKVTTNDMSVLSVTNMGSFVVVWML